MHKVTVICEGQKRIIYVEDGSLLSSVLIRENIDIEHPCSFKGICKKCCVEVNGKREFSCRYRVDGDITVKVAEKSNIMTASTGEESSSVTENMCLCLDLGTTTMVLALVAEDDGKIVKTLTANNPQRAFAADVMSRIEYASKNGVEELCRAVREKVNDMTQELLEYAEGKKIERCYVAGNSTMLHLFFGVPCESMGYAPYTPVFLEEKKVRAEEVGLEGVKEVVSPEGISAFVGADIVAGLGYVEKRSKGEYNFLIDLGTNAEVVLYSKNRLYCTAAAAGPCFEGVNISCGMSAVEGAICSCTEYGFKTVGGIDAKGICATGLIDAVSLMLKHGVIDSSGYMEEKEYNLADNVTLTQADVRQFQLAKGAICSAMEALLRIAGISFDDVERVYVSGGFSSKINFSNALSVGLFPRECQGRLEAVDNSCLKGLADYASGKIDLSRFRRNAEYVDLAADEYFQELFIENMGF